MIYCVCVYVYIDMSKTIHSYCICVYRCVRTHSNIFCWLSMYMYVGRKWKWWKREKKKQNSTRTRTEFRCSCEWRWGGECDEYGLRKLTGCFMREWMNESNEYLSEIGCIFKPCACIVKTKSCMTDKIFTWQLFRTWFKYIHIYIINAMQHIMNQKIYSFETLHTSTHVWHSMA